MYKIDRYIEEYIDKLVETKPLLLSGHNVVEEMCSEIKKINDISVKIDNYSSNIDDMKLKERIAKDRQEKLIFSLINILDGIDWYIETSLVFSNESVNKSVLATKQIIKRELESIKLTSTPNIGDLFNENYHFCAGNKSDSNFADNQIVEVIKKGYIYNDKVFREAEVIVVKNNMEDDYGCYRD